MKIKLDCNNRRVLDGRRRSDSAGCSKVTGSEPDPEQFSTRDTLYSAPVFHNGTQLPNEAALGAAAGAVAPQGVLVIVHTVDLREALPPTTNVSGQFRRC